MRPTAPRWLSVLVALTLGSYSLTACGSDEPTEDTDAAPATAPLHNGQGSVFEPGQGGSLCTWLTDGEISAMVGSAVGGGWSNEEVFKGPLGGWGCWWQTSSSGVLLAPFTESDAHPEAEEAASFPHPALGDDASVMDWPEGDWPPRIESDSDGRRLSALLRIEGRSQLVEFSIEVPADSAIDVDTALSVANDLLTHIGWAEPQ